jgi:hypothetical protein
MTTLDDIRGRGTVSVPEAGQVLGLGRDASFRSAKRGEIPTLRLGRKLRVPVPALLTLLGVPQTDSEPGPSTGPGIALTSVPATGDRSNHGHPSPSPASNNARALRGV